MKFRHLLRSYAVCFGMSERRAEEITSYLSIDPKAGAELQSTGRGPASGPDATPNNTAMLILAILANGPQRQAARIVNGLYMLPVDGSEPNIGEWVVEDALPNPGFPSAACAITGTVYLGSALARILADADLAATIDRIELRRRASEAWIIARDGRSQRFIAEGAADVLAAADAAGHLRVTASIGGTLLHAMAVSLASEVAE